MLDRLFIGWGVFCVIVGGIIIFIFLEFMLGILGASILKSFGVDSNSPKLIHFIVGNSVLILFLTMLYFLGGLI